MKTYSFKNTNTQETFTCTAYSSQEAWGKLRRNTDSALWMWTLVYNN